MASEYPAVGAARQSDARQSTARRPATGRALGVAAALGVGAAAARLVVHLVDAAHVRRRDAGPQAGSTQR